MSENTQIVGRQIAAGRTLAAVSQEELARRANVSVATLRRMEASQGAASGHVNNVAAVRRALEAAGVEFLNGTEPGVRMRTSGDGEMLGVDDQASPADAETFADGDAVAEIAAPSGRRAKPMGRRWTDRPKTSISPEQVKAARELLGWSQDDLAALVGVGETAVSLFEREKRRLLALNVSEVRGVLESAGIEFTGGAQPGAALRPGFETGEQALVLAQRHRRANRPRQEAPSVAPEAEAELEADGAEAMPLDQFLSGLEAYEERRLRPQGIRVGNRGGTKFGFALFYMNRDAASLMLEGKELGRVRWAKGKIEFDPAITRSNPAHTLEDDLDQWASRAYARSLGA